MDVSRALPEPIPPPIPPNDTSNAKTSQQLTSHTFDVDAFAIEAAVAVANDEAIEEGTFKRLTKYLDDHCDLRPLTELAIKAGDRFVEQRDKLNPNRLLPNEEKWNEEIEKVAKELKSGKAHRVERVQKLLKEFEASLPPELQGQLAGISTEKQVIELQDKLVSYVSFGLKFNKISNLLTPEELKLANSGVAIGKSLCPWLKVGQLSNAISTKSQISEHLQNKINSKLAQMEQTPISPQQFKDLQLEVDQLHREKLQVEAEKEEMIEEVTTNVVENVSTLLKGKDPFFSNEMATKLVEGCSQAIIEAAPIAFSAAALAGSAISLGLSLYATAKASQQFMNLKENGELLKKQIAKEQDPIKSIILSAKLDTYATLEAEIGAEIALKVISSTAGGLAVCGAVNTALVAAGVALSTAAHVGLAASGVGAIALTGVAVAGGVAYQAYEHRFEIVHFLNTAEVTPRLFCDQYALRKEIELYVKAKEVFDTLVPKQEEMRMLEGMAYQLKLETDALKGAGSLPKKVMASRQYLKLSEEVIENEKSLETAKKTMIEGSQKIREIQKDMRILNRRQELEDYKLEWRQFQSRFSKYDVATLLAVKSTLDAALVHESGRNSVKELMKQHRYPYVDPITLEQVFDFITERKQILTAA